MEVKIVLGHTFGDEGKGVTVQWLCKKAIEEGKKPLVVRFSGGPQAAHTVFNGGIEHICSSFGSGVLLGVPTMLTHDVYLDPICLTNELHVLKDKGINPTLYMSAHRAITPYDVLAGREDPKVLKDGTCGKGIYATFNRYNNSTSFGSTLLSTYNFSRAGHILGNARKFYNVDSIQEYDDMFKRACLEMATETEFKLLTDTTKDFDVLIFEGSQGLLLDMDRGFYPNVTPSKVGLNGIDERYLKDAEVFLVTRTYTTRHGNGYSPKLPRRYPVKAEHETNVTNEFQGEFKTGLLEFELLNAAYNRHCLDNYKAKYNVSLNLVITHMDSCCLTPQNTYCFDYINKVGGVMYNVGMSARNPLKVIEKHFMANLCYTPNHIYYNDSVESNIKQLR